MDNSWQNYDPAPIEFLHSELLRQFHMYRSGVNNPSEKTEVVIDGLILSNLIAEAKKVTYLMYPGEDKPRPKQILKF